MARPRSRYLCTEDTYGTFAVYGHELEVRKSLFVFTHQRILLYLVLLNLNNILHYSGLKVEKLQLNAEDVFCLPFDQTNSQAAYFLSFCK